MRKIKWRLEGKREAEGRREWIWGRKDGIRWREGGGMRTEDDKEAGGR
jgi:hypothetical protein